MAPLPVRITMSVFRSLMGRELSIVTDLWMIIVAACAAVWAILLIFGMGCLGCSILLFCRKPSSGRFRMTSLAAAAAVIAAISAAVLQPRPIASAEPAPATSVLRLAAYNVRGSDIPDGPHDGWAPHRRYRARAMLWQLDADVVGLQEALEEQTAFFLEPLAAAANSDIVNASSEREVLDAAAAAAAAASGRRYSAVGDRTNSNHPSRDSQLLYDESRLALRDSGTLWLSATPDVTDTKVPGSANVRTMTWALLERKQASATEVAASWCARCFLFVNLHLDHIGERARQEQAALARSFTRAIASRVVTLRAAAAACSAEADAECTAAAVAAHMRPLPVHLMGDFNSIRDSAAHGILTADAAAGAADAAGADAAGADAADADVALQSLVFAATGRLIAAMDAAGQLALDNSAAAAVVPEAAAAATQNLYLWDSLQLVQSQARLLRSNAEAAQPGSDAASAVAAAAASAESDLAVMDPLSFHAFLGRITGASIITFPLRLLVSAFAVTLPPPNPLQWRGPAWSSPPSNALEGLLASASWKLSAWAAERTRGPSGSKRPAGASHATDLHIDWILTGYYGPTPAALADAAQPARRPRQLTPGSVDVTSAAPSLLVSPDGWADRPAGHASRLRLRVINAPSGEGYCSDHYPVTLDFLAAE